MPRDLLSGHDLLNTVERNSVLADIKKFKPHLVTLAPPCGPWSSLQYLSVNKRDPQYLIDLRDRHLPFWEFSLRVWNLVNSYDGRVLIENPWSSEAWHIEYMINKIKQHFCDIQQCAVVLKDPNGL